MDLRHILLVGFFLLSSLGANAIEFGERERSKKFVLRLEKPGNLLLELKKEYKGNQYAELMYIYDEVNMRWEQNGDLIELYRLPTYRDRGEEELAFVLRYDADAQVVVFEPKGILENSDYFEFFEGREWLSANQRDDPGYRVYNSSRKQPRSFYKTKSEGSFPEDTPAVLMNLAARLFRDRVHELRVALIFPGLDEPTLRVVAETMFNKEYDQHAVLQPLVAAHPNTPLDLRDRFFDSQESYYKTHIWRAVAMRNDATDERYQEYLRRIKDGEERDRALVARDLLAPREAWKIAVAPGERDVLKNFSRNPNAPPEMITEIFRSGALQYDARGMASNEQTPVAVLEELSNTEEKQILWSLQRNPSTPEATIQKILAYFGNNVSASLRGNAARDERTPEALLEKLSKDVNTHVRTGVAINKGAPVNLLEQLAEDSHQTPAARARETLMRNHKEVYSAKKGSWTPLDQLNPHNDLSQEFRAAVKAGDQETARKLINYTDDLETRISEMTILSSIQNDNFEEFKDLFKETLIRMEPKATSSIFSRDQVTPEQLKWGIDEGFVTNETLEKTLGDYARKGRADLIEVLENAKMLDSIEVALASECLVSAVLRREVEQTKFWMSKGADPKREVLNGLNALEIARRFYALSTLKLIDEEGLYSEFIEETRREFPVPENQNYVGAWTNRQDGFGEASLTLGEDGSGTIGATMMALPFLWKEVAKDQIELVFVDPESGELVDKRMQLVLTDGQNDPTDGRSSLPRLKAKDANQVFYLISPGID